MLLLGHSNVLSNGSIAYFREDHFSGGRPQQSDIVAVIREALEETKLAPTRLELEITESLLIQRPDDVVAKLKEIKQLGVTIAMDDFGTGYSSLSYLLKFPFDKIKIDKSFVTASSEDVAARDILRTIISLGKTLNIRITAEGVETKEQVEFLRDIACNQLQGYYFAKPLDELSLAAYFLSGRPMVASVNKKPRLSWWADPSITSGWSNTGLCTRTPIRLIPVTRRLLESGAA